MSDQPGRRTRVTPPAVPPPPRLNDQRLRSRRRADHVAQEETAFLARSMDILAGHGSAEQRLAALLELIAAMAGAERAAVLADGDERRVAVAVRPDEDSRGAEDLAAWLDAQAPRSRAERATSAPALVSIAIGAATASDPSRFRPARPASKARVAPADRVDTAPRPAGGFARTQTGSIRPLPDASGPERAASARSEKPLAEASDSPGRERLQPIDRRDSHYACLTIPRSLTVVLGFAFADEAGATACTTRFPPTLVRDAGAALALIADQLATERELETLRAQDTQRNRFVSIVAHELRTPLTGLGGYLELILSDTIEDPTVEREFLERSREIVSSMDELVGDLLELSRLESGSLKLELGAFSVAEIGQRVIEHVAPIAMKRSVQLTSTLPPRLRAATGDRRRVEQILTNLIGNALKFTPAGGTVELSGWFDGPVAVLAVRDDGLGISAEDRGRIFERFFRMTSHERVNGTGLGLPIARELAQAMGGDLDVASVQRSGSSFVLVLPGPTPVDRETIAGILDRALATETIRLEDLGMMRRLHSLHGGAASGQRVAGLRGQPALDANGKPRLERLDGRRTVAGRPAGPVKLRAIEGSGSRREPTTPA